jgi:hypothetical protein
MKTAVRRLYRKLKQAVRGLDEKLDPRWVAAKVWGGRVSLSDNNAYPDLHQLFGSFDGQRFSRLAWAMVSSAGC